MPDQLAPEKGLFYLLLPDIRGGGKGHGLRWANEDALRGPGVHLVPPPNGDPARYPEKPRLQYMPKVGAAPRDLESLAGLWIVAEGLKAVFEAVDPEGFHFAACDVVEADGTPGPDRYLCQVARTLDALDEAASTLTIKTGEDYINGKFYSFSGGARLAFLENVVGAAHVFRTPFSARDTFCDRALRDAVEAAGTTGVWLIDAADC